MKALILIALAACSLPHVAPAPRAQVEQLATVVSVRTDCTSPDPFLANPSVPNEATPSMFPIEWAPSHAATGVVISERHVLTAAHAVRCAAIPSVVVGFRDGHTRRFVVERDDDMFPVGEPSDVARLELASAGGIGVGIAPPVLRDARGGEECCARTLHGPACGTADPYHRGVLLAVTHKGDSGSPVYCSEALVGVVTRSGERTTTFEPVTPYWLEGT